MPTVVFWRLWMKLRGMLIKVHQKLSTDLVKMTKIMGMILTKIGQTTKVVQKAGQSD